MHVWYVDAGIEDTPESPSTLIVLSVYRKHTWGGAPQKNKGRGDATARNVYTVAKYNVERMILNE